MEIEKISMASRTTRTIPRPTLNHTGMILLLHGASVLSVAPCLNLVWFDLMDAVFSLAHSVGPLLGA